MVKLHGLFGTADIETDITKIKSISNSIDHENLNMVTLIIFMIRFLLAVKFKLFLTHVNNSLFSMR